MKSIKGSSDKKSLERFFENRDWLIVKDAALYLSRSENAIRILIHRGTLKAYKLGGRIYLKKREIDNLLERSAVLELFGAEKGGSYDYKRYKGVS